MTTNSKASLFRNAFFFSFTSENLYCAQNLHALCIAAAIAAFKTRSDSFKK